MKIRINGKDEVVDGVTTLNDFISKKGLIPEHIVVEYNNDIIKKDEWPAIMLKEKDSLEIISFVGGG